MNKKETSHRIKFNLVMPTEKYMAYYKGKASYIQVRSLDNRNIKFPANAIRQFLKHDGIHGLFEIHFDKNNKLIEIKKIN